VSLQTRLKRLERSRDAGSCGPGCPPIRIMRRQDWYGTPLAQEPPAPCSRCARPPTVIGVVREPDFFGNAERLREVTT
jgi:hypothetical protein